MDAFAQAALPFGPALYRTARRMTRRSEDAMTVVRGAFQDAQAHVAPASLGPGRRGPLFAALWRTLSARAEGEGLAHNQADSDTPDDRLAPALTGDEAELERALITRLDASPDLDVALRRLAGPERFAVLMVDVEDLSYEEAVGALGVDLDTLRGLLLSARARIFLTLYEFARRTSGVRPAARR